MEADEAPPVAPSVLPDHVVDEIAELDESALRALIEFSRSRLQFVHPDVTEQIEAKEGEELVRVEDRGAYTEVVKRLPCAERCDDCPHEPVLFHVTEERRPGGSTGLHWRYLGRIRE